MELSALYPAVNSHDRKSEKLRCLSLADEVLKARSPLISKTDLVSDYQNGFARHHFGARLFAVAGRVGCGESGVDPERIEGVFSSRHVTPGVPCYPKGNCNRSNRQAAPHEGQRTVQILLNAREPLGDPERLFWLSGFSCFVLLENGALFDVQADTGGQVAEALSDHLQVRRFDFVADAGSARPHGRLRRAPCSQERIQDCVSNKREHPN